MSNPAKRSIGINPADFPIGAFTEVLDKKLNSSEADGLEAQTMEAVLQTDPPFRFERRFGTLASACAFHKLAVKRLRARERLMRKEPEREQQLLAELRLWCGRKWGRQAEVARRIGVSPQTVNDWLTDRKKMTGNQALNVLELVAKERKRKRLVPD
jgi:DNA-binding XRE family transcriptional regulator